MATVKYKASVTGIIKLKIIAAAISKKLGFNSAHDMLMRSAKKGLIFVPVK